MERRKLGAGGPEVSAVGVGAMSFGGFYGPTTEAESHALLAAALELGIDHVDTANVYGMGVSESVIGSFLRGRKGPSPFRIATKGAITRDAEGRRKFDNSGAHLAKELDGSLKRLGVDTVDLYYVHRRDPAVPIEEVAGTMAELVRAGNARAIGFSEIAPSSLRRANAVHRLRRCSRSIPSPRARPSSGWCRPARRSGWRSLPSRRSRARC